MIQDLGQVREGLAGRRHWQLSRAGLRARAVAGGVERRMLLEAMLGMEAPGLWDYLEMSRWERRPEAGFGVLGRGQV